MRFDVVCFGSSVVDVIVKLDSKQKNEFKFSCGTKVLMKGLDFQTGGGGSNTAVAFSRLGLKTGFIGKIGNDHIGEDLLDLFKSEKITFLGKQIRGETSGFSVILLNQFGQRTILTHKGINDEVSEKDIQHFETNWAYFSSLMGKSFKTQIKLAKKLKKQGVKIAYNPSEYLIKKINTKKLIKYCDALILNKEEAELLTKKENKLRIIQKMLHDKNGIVIITDGQGKVYCVSGEKKYSITPPKVEVVDSTGAGDAFAAGFVGGLVVGKSAPDSLRIAMRESLAVLKYPGAKNNLLRMNLRRGK